MRKEFLRIIAEIFIDKYGEDLRKYCFVFSNRRASIFFLRYLSQTIKKPVFAPEIVAINDLFSSLSEKKIADRLVLLAKLYKAYSSVIKDDTQSFDDFVFWGEMLLGDFDDVDKYRAKAENLFKNIRDLKEISDVYDYLNEAQRKTIEEFWGTVLEKTGMAEKHFAELWGKMYNIYSTFKESLEKDGTGYEGMIYRDVADRIANGDTEKIENALSKYEQVVFVGMNALNECEKTLFDYLRKIRKGDFYWDFFGTWVKDPENRASKFLQENVKKYPSCLPMPENGGLPDAPPRIEAIALSSATGQAKYVHGLLEEILKGHDSHDLFSTAIVLPDEKMLFPLLNSIPERIDKVNVTMGYPLSQSSASSFISIISDLWIKKREQDGKMSFYFRNVLDIFSHLYLKKAVNNGLLRKLRKKIISKSSIYVPADFFAEEKDDSGILNLIFGMSTNTRPPDYVKSLLEKIADKASNLEKEFLLGYYRCINQIVFIESELGNELQDKTFFTLLRRVASGMTVPFRGEPLAGLQIMGTLETRTLDFENVIILSVNEGIFPRANVAPSMIPYNLRNVFGLPTYEYRDAVLAYHFYRSIARAKNVWLLYDSRTDGLKTGEESRYVKQLEYHHKVNITRKTVASRLKTGSILTAVEKTDDMIADMKKRTYSPSAISTYMRCSMKFYYQYIKQLKEEDELTEDIDAVLFGSLFHKTMELTYQEFREQKITQTIINDEILKSDLDKIVEEAFKEVVHVEEIAGKNIIIKEMIKEYAKAVLNYDARQVSPFIYEGSEGEYEANIEIDENNTLKIKGIIDRLDKIGDRFRIVDYKTGSKKASFKKENIKDMFSQKEFNTWEHVFQLYFYLTILRESKKIENADNVLLSLYYVTDLFNRKSSDFEVTEDDCKTFRGQLITLFVDTIWNREESFKLCEDTDFCQNCSFKILCNR